MILLYVQKVNPEKSIPKALQKSVLTWSLFDWIISEANWGPIIGFHAPLFAYFHMFCLWTDKTNLLTRVNRQYLGCSKFLFALTAFSNQSKPLRLFSQETKAFLLFRWKDVRILSYANLKLYPNANIPNLLISLLKFFRFLHTADYFIMIWCGNSRCFWDVLLSFRSSVCPCNCPLQPLNRTESILEEWFLVD